MRYISAPQRSHFTASSDDAGGAARKAEKIGVTTSLTGGLSTRSLYRPYFFEIRTTPATV